jgi:hypothetical protein
VRIAVMTLVVLLSASAARAQKLEIGGTIAAGCKGSEDSLCGGEKSPLIGAHASVWANNRVELTARLARVGWEDFSYKLDGFDIDVTNQSRSFVSFLFIYHFMEGRPVRPMLGLGSGWYSENSRVACRPAGCQTQIRPGPGDRLLGSYREWDIDAIFVLGLSGTVRDRWVWRGGWQSHRFGNDENMTQEFFAGLGYRFGGR